ncbi:MAG: cytochrome c biogenesis heme-transporting ATPase CcmA [Caldimonas sp.]
MSPASTSELVLTGLACGRGERLLFDGLDLVAPAGQIVWVRGANGRGKTTLLRTLAGLSAPAAGSFELRGDVALHAPLYLGHANALKDDLTVAESLRFLLRLDGADDAAAALAALDLLGMASRRDAPVRTLSQGQRRRVALARLAAHSRPALWLLDEPYDALDAPGAAVLDALLTAHARRGGIVVIASHLPLAIADPLPRELSLEAPAASDVVAA